MSIAASRWTATGKRRLRSTLFGFAVIEVEEQREDWALGDMGTLTTRRWRRARRNEIVRHGDDARLDLA